jgi:polysaccharide export outer membrane protein
MTTGIAAQVSPAMAKDTPAATPSFRDAYRVGTGDRLKISVYNAEKLSGEYPVGGDGKIAVPMLGRVLVAGLTLDGIADTLTTRLKDGYLLNPSLTVDIQAYRSVFILGEVDKPGQYPYTEGMTLLQLVSQAGGFTYRANRGTIKLRHEGEAKEAKYRVDGDGMVRPGDTVVIMQRYF